MNKKHLVGMRRGRSAQAAGIERLEQRNLLSVKIQFDYSLDWNNFFDDPTRRATLQAAADSITSRLGDTLNAITPSGDNFWQVTIVNPSTGQRELLDNPSLPADVVRVFAGSLYPLTVAASGSRGEPGIFGSDAWRKSVIDRGEAGAYSDLNNPTPLTDTAPSIGYLTFKHDLPWHFGATTSGLDATENDFYANAQHELAHILGFGSSGSWVRLVSNGTFTGPAAKAARGGTPVPISQTDPWYDHWAEGVSSGGQEAAMDPTLKVGTRKNFTPLDFAALDDIGWELKPVSGGTGSIAGNIFNDLDADGVKDTGEGPLGAWKLFLDADRDGVLDTGEKTTTTDSAGNYTFTGLAAQSYRVREVLGFGWRRTTPTSGYHDVTLASGQNVTGKNFGNTQKVLIAGAVWNDLDGDGVKDSGEPGIASRKLFIDTDRDGVFDSTERYTLTDASGNYSFKLLSAGSYRVRETPLPSGWRRTKPSPTAPYYDVTLANGATTTGRDFGSTQKVLISGTVFNDLDGDRVKDSGEGGLGSWRVFIDTDGDGFLDAGESSVLTDSSGNWKFTALSAGTFKVRVVQQTGWTRTTPTSGYHSVTLSNGGSSTGKLFGERKNA